MRLQSNSPPLPPLHNLALLCMLAAGCGPLVPLDTDSGAESGDVSSGVDSDTAGSSDNPPQLSTSGPGTSGPASTTVATTGSSTSSAATTGLTQATMTGDSGTTGGPACDGYLGDPDIGPAVTLTILNDGPTPVYIEPLGCTWEPPIQLGGPAGGAVFYAEDPCAVPCENFMDNDACWTDCPDCAAPPPMRLEPGATWSAVWSGVSKRGDVMPEQCTLAGDCDVSCIVPEQASPGLYSASVLVYASCDGDPDSNDCYCDDPDAEMCSVSGSVNGAFLTAETFDYPAQGEVTLFAGAPPPPPTPE